MIKRSIAPIKKDRRKAVFLCVGLTLVWCAGLSGCSRLADRPLLGTLAAFLPGHKDVSAAARKVPYASIDFTVGHRNGLLILAEKTPRLTFWKASQAETLVLQDGFLQSTSGLQQNLQMTRITSENGGHESAPWRIALDQPVSYDILRSWSGSSGNILTERAKANLVCDPGTSPVKLPLATLTLRRCQQTLHWDSGRTTESILWIDPKSARLWAANTVPWPGAPRFDWKVARPWW